MAISFVRGVRQEDLLRIYEVERDSFAHPYPPYLIDSLYEKNKRTFFVAAVGGRIIGYSVASVESRDTGHLISVAVSHDMRRRGIGGALLQRLIEELRRLGVSRIKLEVEMGNVAAQNMYKKLGFEITNSVRDYYEDGSDALVMTLELK